MWRQILKSLAPHILRYTAAAQHTAAYLLSGTSVTFT